MKGESGKRRNVGDVRGQLLVNLEEEEDHEDCCCNVKPDRRWRTDCQCWGGS